MTKHSSQKMSAVLGINLDSLDSSDCFRLISEELLECLSAPDLRRVRELAEEKRQAKLNANKYNVIEEIRGTLDAMGIEPNEVALSFGKGRRTGRATGRTVSPKYRSPDGEIWSGRGSAPAWLQSLEEQGYKREDFLVKEE
jgi:DNA-binding protein H-NS